jgi:hypothetical protein
VAEKVQSASANGSARRKLVKGAFALPAMVTLHSGGAVAASAGTGLKQRNESDATQPVSNSDDLWFRIELKGWVHRQYQDKWFSRSNARIYWIDGNDLPSINGVSPWLKPGDFQEFDIVSNTLAQSTGRQFPEQPQAAWKWAGTGKWVSLRVDNEGAVTGAGATGDGAAVADSVWASFVGFH